MSWAVADISGIVTQYEDWDDAQTDLAHLGGAKPGAAKSGGDKLWEDNWDDDDIEDDFSVQLRYRTLPLTYHWFLKLTYRCFLQE